MAKKRAPQGKAKSKETKKALDKLISKGKKQGYLTYDDVNKALPETMLTPDHVDDTLMTFDKHNIEVLDNAPSKSKAKPKKSASKKRLEISLTSICCLVLRCFVVLGPLLEV